MRSYRIQFYQDEKLEWRWRISASNGNIIATSHEGYKLKSHCRQIVRKFFSIIRYNLIKEIE